MSAAHILSRRLVKRTELDQSGPDWDSFRSPSLSTNDLPSEPTHEVGSHDLRFVVEQQFRRMNNAHDRIRTEMLCGNNHSEE